VSQEIESAILYMFPGLLPSIFQQVPNPEKWAKMAQAEAVIWP